MATNLIGFEALAWNFFARVLAPFEVVLLLVLADLLVAVADEEEEEEPQLVLRFLSFGFWACSSCCCFLPCTWSAFGLACSDKSWLMGEAGTFSLPLPLLVVVLLGEPVRGLSSTINPLAVFVAVGVELSFGLKDTAATVAREHMTVLVLGVALMLSLGVCVLLFACGVRAPSGVENVGVSHSSSYCPVLSFSSWSSSSVSAWRGLCRTVTLTELLLIVSSVLVLSESLRSTVV